VALETWRFADSSLGRSGAFAEEREFGASRGKPRPISCPICQTAACFMAAHPEANIYRCQCCTHAFSDPGSMPQQESYDPGYYNDTHRRWFQHPNTALFARITAIIPIGASVLDVGCGRGDFLRYVHKNRPDVRLTGIDYSPNQDKIIRFLQGDAFELNIRDRFDVVVSLAVIEHVSDCVAFTNRLRELTKPGGTIAIMTVNESSILYGLARMGRLLGVPLAFDRLYSRHHLHHFTRASLLRLLESCGLKLSEHILHNSPVKAVDLPVHSPMADAVLRIMVGGVCGAGYALSKGYLQTVICSAS
jgi:2-polyprenyl-3-methyl-5-hydroxy-6-metoxy-1,4-benzoquinol methylase